MEFKVENLTVQYPFNFLPAVENASFQFLSGSMNFILGPNGCGKSTLLRCMAGQQYWKSGEIYLNGVSRKIDLADFNRGLHFIAEEISLPDLKVADLAKVYASAWGSWDNETFKRIVELGDIDVTRGAAQFSRGQKVQIQMALALATKPKCMLLDEVTAVLDPFMRSRLMLELEAANKTHGTTVVLSTNIATELRGFSGQLIFMKAGKIFMSGHSTEVIKGFKKILAPGSSGESLKKAGFTFLEVNADGSMIFIGPQTGSAGSEVSSDQRAVTIDEAFIWISQRGAG